jgi:glycerophosphoryl diester phosphodiesterase
VRRDRGARAAIRPLIVAHRGSSGTAPENTLAAFKQAIDDHADMIELDVRMSKDYELVVLHDRGVRRTTNAKGSIWNLTLGDLRRFDAGSWFHRKFSEERIPSLRQVIDILPQHLRLNIEVKTDGDRRKNLAFQESLILLLREKNFVQRATVSSFDHKFLQRLHKLDPDILIGVLYSPIRDVAKSPSKLARKTGASAFICAISQLRKKFVEEAHANSIKLGCYGVNKRKQLEKAMKSGVELVITDHPKEIRDWLRKMK